MKRIIDPDSARQINNLVARIKSRYPHLYEETGGKYIRKILRGVLDSQESEVLEESTLHLRSNGYRATRVVRHKHTSQRAA